MILGISMNIFLQKHAILPQLEGRAARMYNCLQGGSGEIKAEKKRKKHAILSCTVVFELNH